MSGFSQGVPAWQSWTSTISAAVGTIATVGAVTARYVRAGNTVTFNIEINITANGTGASYLQFTLPFAKKAGSGRGDFLGQELLVTGKMLAGFLNAGSSTVALRYYDGTYPGADGAQVVVSGTYEV